MVEIRKQPGIGLKRGEEGVTRFERRRDSSSFDTLVADEIGLGDAMKRATYGMGLTPCRACEKRAAALNRFLVFSSRPR
jgi:hypothetical protein